MLEFALGLGVVALVCMLCGSVWLMREWFRLRRPWWIVCNGFAICLLLQVLADVSRLLAQLMQSF